MPLQSKLRQYDDDEVNLAALSDKAFEVLGKRPFRWQLEASEAVLYGKDVIIDVGTGCGKSLCFTLPILLNDEDIALTVSPLTALMLDQARIAEHSRLPTVAVCNDTVSRVGKDQLYKDIVDRKFRQVLVSPEIATSQEFLKTVLSKTSFTEHVRVLNIDEAHCITVWGGSFRPDYANLGILRGRFPRSLSEVIASATLPDYLLDDVCGKLHLSKNLKKVCVTNARPNIALSVRVMQHSEDSKGDLRFIIPPEADSPEDIPITIVYCNSRTMTEEATDRTRDWAIDQGISPDCIAYYHALVGEDRKREIEDQLKKGTTRIIYATEAIGMGCDFQNILRVVLWGLPPTFCALVQRSGRAGRNPEDDAESICIVSKSVMKEDIEEVIRETQESIGTTAVEAEALDRIITDNEFHEVEDMLDAEGIRVSGISDDDTNDSDSEPEPVAAITSMSKSKRKKQFSKDTNITEIRRLLSYVRTKECRRKPWNEHFNNADKLQLIYGQTTMARPKPGRRCCDNCNPTKFPVEKIKVVKAQKGLKRGKKKKTPEEESNYVIKKLQTWRDEKLMEKHYGDLTSLPPTTLMSDGIIKKIASCGSRIRNYTELRRHVLWAFGHSKREDGPNEYGKMLMVELERIYEVLDNYDRQAKEEEKRVAREKEMREAEERYRANTAVFNILTEADFN